MKINYNHFSQAILKTSQVENINIQALYEINKVYMLVNWYKAQQSL